MKYVSADSDITVIPDATWRECDFSINHGCDPFLALLPATSGSLRLQRLVESSRACYAIEWVCVDGHLKYKAHYNPPWRVEGARRQGLKGLYTADSARHVFVPGEGLIGRAFKERKDIFVDDVQIVHPMEYARVDLAKEYGIHSAMFLPFTEGVIEVGSTHHFQVGSALLSDRVIRSSLIRSQ
jgi:hypothetical protein